MNLADKHNAAAMREALDKVLNAIKHLSKIHNDNLPEDVRATLGLMAFDANEALAAPPRNCDRFKDASDAWDAYDAFVDSYRAQGKTEPLNEFGWLYAKATEKEGGNK